MSRIFTILVISITALLFHQGAEAETTPGQKAVLVTGASSGPGRTMTETMAALIEMLDAAIAKQARVSQQ